MPYVLKGSAALGKVALYRVDSLASVPSGPLTAPDDHAADVHFHSDWYYPRVVSANRSGSAVIPSGAANTFQNDSIQLFAHGQASVPMVLGTVTVGGRTLTLGGDVAVDRTTTNGNVSITWLSLEVDATYVYLHYYGAIRSGTGGAAAMTVGYNVQVTDMLVTGAGPVGDAAQPLASYNAAGNYVTLGRGKFDSRRRYLKRGSGGLQVVRGATLQMIQRANNLNSIQNGYGVVWGYALDGHKAPAYIAATGLITINPAFTAATV